MTAQNKWVLVVALVALIVAVVLVSRRTEAPRPAAQGQAVGAAQAPGAPASALRPAPPGAPPGAPAPVPVAIGANDPVPGPPRAMPYRPAELLIYSQQQVAESPDQDASSPTLARIFEVTRADETQQEQIRARWRTHEDGRRILFAAAYPRISGPRILDHDKLAELDLAFEAALFSEILRPAQRSRLAQELPRPGQQAPTPQVYTTPPK